MGLVKFLSVLIFFMSLGLVAKNSGDSKKHFLACFGVHYCTSPSVANYTCDNWDYFSSAQKGAEGLANKDCCARPGHEGHSVGFFFKGCRW